MEEGKVELYLAQQQALLIKEIEELKKEIGDLKNSIDEDRRIKQEKIMRMNTAKKTKTKARILKIKHIVESIGFINTRDVMRSVKVSRVSALKLMEKVSKNFKNIILVKRAANRGGHYLTINKTIA